ncbi:MAG: hypothetical protein K1X74_15125 [Pirellulales bacterium]|nr:hypothetical protein [Pirellulales bacterium]
MTSSRQAAAIVALLCVLTVAVYYRVAGHEFVGWDDPTYVRDNPRIQQGLTLATIGWAFTTGYAGNWHPLTWLSHTVDWSLFGNWAPGHHLVNAALHLVNSLVLFYALWSLQAAGQPREPASKGRGEAAAAVSPWPAGLVAALFAVHPLHVESVAWVSERKDTLSTLFWLLAMLAYTGYVLRPGLGRYALVALALTLGLLSKPMVVTLPAVLLLLDFWPLARDKARGGRRGVPAAAWPQLAREKLPLLALVVISALATLWAQSAAQAVAATEQVSLLMRLGNACLSYLAYLKFCIWPAGLAYFYPIDQASWQSAGQMMLAAAAALLLAVITAAAVFGRRRCPYFFVGWLWYLGTLVPVIGFVQVGSQAMADRYTYIPLIGVFIAVAYGLADLLAARPNLRNLGVAAAVGWVLVLSVLAWRQVGVWANDERLFSHALSVTERNYSAMSNLAQVRINQQRKDEALELLRQALAINPHSALIHHRLAIALGEPPLNQWAAAKAEFARAIELAPGQMESRLGLAKILTILGEFEPALREYELVSQSPAHRAQAEAELAALRRRMQVAAQLLAQAKAALAAAPNDPQAHCLLGRALLTARRIDEADAAFRAALSRDPKSVPAFLGLAEVAKARMQPSEVIANYRRALELAPGEPTITNQLAWLLATTKDESLRRGPEALTLAQQLCAGAGGQQPEYLDTLAAAYAAAGDFSAAIATIDRAIELATAAGHPPALVRQMQTHRQCYVNRQVYVE